MMCYFIYWAIQLPFMLVSPHKIRWLFLAKALIVPPSWLALLIWAFVKVPSSKGLFTLHATATGSDFSWAYLSALNVALGFYATLAVNIPDFTVGIPENLVRSFWTLMGSLSDMQRTKDREAHPLRSK
jgi:NCS1 family nucleobase:cation symporter-1